MRLLEFRLWLNKTFLTVMNPLNWDTGLLEFINITLGDGFSEAYESELSKFTERYQDVLTDIEKEGSLGEQAARILDQPREDFMEQWRSTLFDQFFPDFGADTVELWANRQIGQLFDSMMKAIQEFFTPDWFERAVLRTSNYSDRSHTAPRGSAAPYTATQAYEAIEWDRRGYGGMNTYGTAAQAGLAGGNPPAGLVIGGSASNPAMPTRHPKVMQLYRERRDDMDFQSQIDAGYNTTAGLGQEEGKSWWERLLENLGISYGSGGSGRGGAVDMQAQVKEGMSEVTGEIDKGFTEYFNNEFPDTSGLAIHELETMYGVGEGDPPDKSFMGVTNLYSESSGVVLDGVMDSWNASVATINAAYDNIIGKANSVLKLADKMPKGPEQSALLSLQVTPPAAFAMGGTSQGGWAMVGEHGPELVHLKAGAQVYSSVDTDRIVNEFQKTNRTEQTNIYVNHMDDNAMQELVLKQNIRRAQRHFG